MTILFVISSSSRDPLEKKKKKDQPQFKNFYPLRVRKYSWE